jgi:hypothetical protein
MSGTDARGQAGRAAVPPQGPGREDPGATAPGGGAGRAGGILPPGTGHVRRRWAVTVAGVVLAVAAGTVWLAGGFGTRGRSGLGNGAGLYGTTTQTVRRQTLSARTAVTGTLGYGDSWTVTGHGGGTLTWLPSAGTVIGQGHALYRVDDGSPVVLLYGSVPDWRNLAEGVSGADVAQLNHDLVALGDANGSDIAALGWDHFSRATTAGVDKLQSHLGISSPPGSLPRGRVVFEPEALRVSRVTGGLGAPASGPVLQATSDRNVVTVSLDAGDQSEVAKGDPVSVTLLDGSSTPGVISSVGTVATGHGGSANITVLVRLDHPGAAGHLDQAPVTVNITTSRVRGVLAVPVAALVARPGGYAVEVVSGGRHRLVPVRPGLFDDAAGMVQVTGPGLAAGQRVVVPRS